MSEQTQDAVAILERAIEIMQQTQVMLHRIEKQYFEPVVAPEWIDKHAASAIVGRHWNTLWRWTRDPDKGLLEGIHWQNTGYEIIYNRELLQDWMRHRHDPATHLRVVEEYQRSRQPQQKKKQKEKRSA